MAKLSIKAGSTSVTVNLFIMDSASTTGAGKTGLAYNTSSLTAYYCLPGAAAAAITLATQTVTGAYSSGGFVEIDATNMPGWYRFDVPNAAIASGRFSSIHFKGASGMAPLPLEIELTAVDNSDAVRFGLTALPNVNSGSAGAIITSGTGTAQLAVTSGRADANVTYYGGSAGTFSGGRPEVNTTHIAGTAWASADFSTTMKASINTEADTAASDYGALKPTVAGRTLDVTTGGEAGIDWANVGSPTTSVNLSGTTVGTITTYTGNTPQTGDTYALANGASGFAAIYGKVDTEVASIITLLGTPAGASVSADIAAAKVDTAAIKVKTDYLPSATAGAAGGVVIAGSNAATTFATLTSTGAFTTNGVADVAQTGDNYARTTKAIVTGSITGGASTVTSLNTTGLSPAAAVTDQFKGRILIFDSDTTTANLRGQATDITASTAGGVLTCTALTTAPAAGDTFKIY